MNLVKNFFKTIEDYKNKIAIFQGDNTISYSELLSLILRIAHKLNSQNLSQQEKIIIIADNSIFFIASYFGIIASGNVAVPLHKDFGKDNFEHVYKSCDVKVSFLQKKYIKKLDTLEISKQIIYTDSEYENIENIFNFEEKENKIQEVNEEKDLAVLIFTSGSTGIPKGVMQSHKNIISNTNSIIEYLDLKSTDRMMVVLPFSYCFGTSLLHTHIKVGAQVVLNNKFMFPGKVLNEINEKGCTGFAGVPSTYQILLRKSAIKKMEFPSLRLVQQAGGKLPRPFIKELRETLPKTQIFIMYGQTEATARLSYLKPEDLDTKLGSIGKGIPGTTLEVFNKNGEPCKPNEIGEIVASGDNITLGYWNDPIETAKNFKNGKLYTGDIGYIDEDGYIFVTDREKDFIKSGGFRVSSKEIENYIAEIEDVVEVAIIGIPDEILGEAIKAYISIKDDSTITEKDIIDKLRKNLANHKIPKEIEFLDSLPKNTSNKISKVDLRILDRKKREHNV